MAKYTGKGLIIQWIWTGGTVTLQSDLLSLETKRTLDLLDVTSGSSQNKQKIDNTMDVTATLKLYDQNTQAANQGTALGAAFDIDNYGTLLWGPQGTATGKPKFGFAGYSKEFSMPLDTQKATELEVTIERDGAWLFNWGSSW